MSMWAPKSASAPSRLPGASRRQALRVAVTAVTAVAALLCLGARGASAQSPEAPAAFTYDAPTDCPSSADFLRAVLARTGQLSRTDPGGPYALVVSVVRAKAGFTGRLRIETQNAQPLERTLEDGHCGALVEALALLAAMELAPIVSNTPSRARSKPTPTATHRPNQAALLGSQHATPRDGEAAVALSGVAGLQRAPIPGALWTGGVHLAFKHRSHAQRVGVSVYYGQTGLLRFDGGDVRFRWSAARLFGCPFGLKRRTIGLAVAICATAEFGLLRGEPQRANRRQSRNGRWIAPGFGALLSLERAGFLFDLFGGVTRPLQRDTFYFASPQSSAAPEIVNLPPRFGLTAELRLGATF